MQKATSNKIQLGETLNPLPSINDENLIELQNLIKFKGL